MKKLFSLLEGIGILHAEGSMEIDIVSVQSDSRKVVPGTLFAAVKGTREDGHSYIAGAIKAGAAAIICNELPADRSPAVSWIKVKSTSEALGKSASNFHGNPSSLIKLTGVTGTNGKTTTATLLYNLFTGLGYKCGLFSTVCNYIAGKEYPATLTTPDPVNLNAMLSEMVRQGCSHAFMEVSSHAVDQKRISGLKFSGGIFTNITHDHLDYHKTFENYIAAKKGFFDSLERDAFALVNADDRNAGVMLQNCTARKHTFSTRAMADFRGGIIEQGLEGMALRIDGEEVWTHFIGGFNASNILAAYSAARLLGADKKETLTCLSALKPVAGRLEVIRGGFPATGIVDYAHTPDALVNVIDTINKTRPGNGKLITVVGAGGDRDRTKRPLMASICASGSDRVILTSDNPRSEDPEKILDDMEAGVAQEFKHKVLRISDRRSAIRTAVSIAGRGDVILVAGKGHETYQDAKGVRTHFDDREELAKALLTRI